nr:MULTISPECIES: SCO family protein [Bacillus]
MILFIILIIGSVMGCSKGIDNRLNWEVPNFTYTNQDGETVSKNSLENKIWIANFIFTNCSTVCPPMTSNMAKLKQMAEKEKLDVKFVSFSVDPDLDTPKKLKDYGMKFSKDLSNWSFLTGYSQQEIEKIAKEGFKILVEKEPNSDQVSHGTYFYLVDQEGKIARYYHGEKDVPLEEIINHIKALQ